MDTLTTENRKHSVLLLDDDLNILHSMQRLFNNHPSVHLITTDSPKEAKDILNSKDISILVTDQRMPECSGTEMLEYAKSHRPETLRLLLTGYADTEVLAESINYGNIHRYYAKPVDPAAFIHEIEDHIRHFESQETERKQLGKLQSNARTLDDLNKKLNKLLQEKNIDFSLAKESLSSLVRFGKTIGEERVEENIFRVVMETCRSVTGADAVTVYRIELKENEESLLRVVYSFVHSHNTPLQVLPIPLNSPTPVGFVARKMKSIAIAEADQLPQDTPYKLDGTSRALSDYPTKSLAVVPIKDFKGMPLGVIELVNRKKSLPKGNGIEEDILLSQTDFDEKTEPFTSEQIAFVEALADHAGMALENGRLIQKMKMQFDEFIIASIQAIEARDPATGGHSLRVASICGKIARVMGFDSTQIQEMEYAAILHDFGKIYIDQEILIKQNKLKEHDLERIDLSLDYLYRYQEFCYARLELRLVNTTLSDSIDSSFLLLELHNDRDQVLASIKQAKNEIAKLNKPRGMFGKEEKEELERIVKFINSLKCLDLVERPFLPLRTSDVESLMTGKGTLNDNERLHIQVHVEYSYHILKALPWPDHLREIPNIAFFHHERLDGSGYPIGAVSEDISLPSRILAVADIFDALTASDRSYKKKMSVDSALKIIQAEVDEGKLDANVVKVLKEIVVL